MGKRFVAKSRPPRKTIKVPLVSELTTHPSVLVAPPEEVCKQLGFHPLIVGVDIETHDWENNAGSKGEEGPFGHYSRCDSNVYDARIVQIGWAVRRGEEEIHVKEKLVKPQGFTISKKAEAFHGISHERACSEGLSMYDVMTEFIQDMCVLHDEGARLVVHHLEFDCGIIARELNRIGLDHFQDTWADLARKGFCTMDPCIGKWLRTCKGLQLAPHYGGNIMKLDDMIRCLVPDTIFGTRHTAGCDARLHVAVFDALYNMMREASALERPEDFIVR